VWRRLVGWNEGGENERFGGKEGGFEVCSRGLVFFTLLSRVKLLKWATAHPTFPTPTGQSATHVCHPNRTHPKESTRGSAPSRSSPAALANATASRQGRVGRAAGGGGEEGRGCSLVALASPPLPALSQRAASAGEGQAEEGGDGDGSARPHPPAAISARRRPLPPSSPDTAASCSARVRADGAMRLRSAVRPRPSRRRARRAASMLVTEKRKSEGLARL
jgi:hypothetical protein